MSEVWGTRGPKAGWRGVNGRRGEGESESESAREAELPSDRGQEGVSGPARRRSTPRPSARVTTLLLPRRGGGGPAGGREDEVKRTAGQGADKGGGDCGYCSGQATATATGPTCNRQLTNNWPHWARVMRLAPAYSLGYGVLGFKAAGNRPARWTGGQVDSLEALRGEASKERMT